MKEVRFKQIHKEHILSLAYKMHKVYKQKKKMLNNASHIDEKRYKDTVQHEKSVQRQLQLFLDKYYRGKQERLSNLFNCFVQLYELDNKEHIDVYF